MAELEKPLSICSRRYIGNKAKLASWIMEAILSNSTGDSFCDLFSGTGVIANAAIPHYKHVIVNDFLHSNNIIHNAFFGKGCFSQSKLDNIIRAYNEIDVNNIPDNYFSKNFGGKYFDHGNARLIGYIRQDIATRTDLTKREHDILLSVLIYGMDRVANTVGHYDAYLKNEIRTLPLRLIPLDIYINPCIDIYRKDANVLVREIESDIFYIDPPYNSRQYSRFYHIYENLVKWKCPPLYGVALKPSPENMSRYCTTKAMAAFCDLIEHIDARWIAVSYNNTYHSKSGSSRNRISLENMEAILRRRGKIRIFETSYYPFTTGKTSFADHREYLFFVTVDKGPRAHEKRV